MKRKLLTIVVIMIMITGCGKEQGLDYVNRKLHLSIKEGDIISDERDNGGMGNDGTKVIKIKVIDEDLAEKLDYSKKWYDEPTDLINYLLYDFNWDENIFPKFENAYYYFENKNATKDDMSVLYDSSLNFIIGIYDMNTSELYYYEYDS